MPQISFKVEKKKGMDRQEIYDKIVALRGQVSERQPWRLCRIAQQCERRNLCM